MISCVEISGKNLKDFLDWLKMPEGYSIDPHDLDVYDEIRDGDEHVVSGELQYFGNKEDNKHYKLVDLILQFFIEKNIKAVFSIGYHN